MLIARWLAAALFVLSVPAFLVLSNVRVAASEPRIQRYGFSQYGVDIVTGVSRSELNRAAEDVSRYFHDNREVLSLRVQVNGEQEALFKPREVAHMKDVKGLMQLVFHLQELAFVYILGYVGIVVLWTRERSMRRFAQLSMIAGLVTAVLLTGAALAMLVGFDRLFLEFHLLSFSNDFWQLDPATDRLIQMFPQGFWFDVSLGVGVLSVMEGGIVALTGFAYLRWTARGPWRRGFGALGDPSGRGRVAELG